jgi:hypothetical protein
LSISRSGSLARAGSLALRPLQHANIGIFGWGRNDCGEWRSGCPTSL